MSNVAVTWAGAGSQLFIGRDSYGHVTTAGSWAGEEHSWQAWKATKPSDLLLISLAACSGYDVVMISKRQRQALTDLYVEVQGNQKSDPPYQFTDIHLHYIVKGEALDPQKVERAIQLSQEQYCSVAATIRGVAQLSYSFEIEEPVSTR